ncbi:hypothetical protein ACFFGH_27795 [Lysobacter korlensis]|uniref:Polymerase nucleotidyl transferase domain-containing protein n=1 Tax=Lysobacter korlensis TaxID=553636 RepID=A0ABV6RXD2_9GAMM
MKAFSDVPVELLHVYDYAVLSDGALLAVHAATESGHLIGDLAYLPDTRGRYLIDGRRYSRVHGRSQPHPFRRDVLAASAPLGWQLIAAKSIVATADAVATANCHDMLSRRLDGPLARRVQGLLDWISNHVVPDGSSVRFGLTGSVGLVDERCESLAEPHDFDIVIEAPVETIDRVVQSAGLLVTTSPPLRVHEYGKGWRIRIRSPLGLICLFFRTPAPLLDVMDWDRQPDRATSVTCHGLVLDVTRASLTPCVVEIDDRSLGRTTVVFPGLRLRGDASVGDELTADGVLYEFEQGPRKSVLRRVIVENDVRAYVTPQPWPGY